MKLSLGTLHIFVPHEWDFFCNIISHCFVSGNNDATDFYMLIFIQQSCCIFNNANNLVVHLLRYSICYPCDLSRLFWLYLSNLNK